MHGDECAYWQENEECNCGYWEKRNGSANTDNK